MASWKELIEIEMDCQGESFDDVVSCTLSDEELIKEFDDDFGAIEGAPFTLWTHNRVYFPAEYDGSESAESVSRNPDGKPTAHVGG